MTYAIAPALQTAIYDALRSAPVVTDLVGDAIYDTIPPGARGGTKWQGSFDQNRHDRRRGL